MSPIENKNYVAFGSPLKIIIVFSMHFDDLFAIFGEKSCLSVFCFSMVLSTLIIILQYTCRLYPYFMMIKHSRTLDVFAILYTELYMDPMNIQKSHIHITCPMRIHHIPIGSSRVESMVKHCETAPFFYAKTLDKMLVYVVTFIV